MPSPVAKPARSLLVWIDELEAQIALIPDEVDEKPLVMPALHPGTAAAYQRSVSDLRAALAEGTN
jgi:hypothetical protein